MIKNLFTLAKITLSALQSTVVESKYKRLKTLFTAAIQIYCDAITQQTQPTHKMHSSEWKGSNTRETRFIDQIC